MGYEIGKEYTFTNKQFTPSRETGRLYFIIGDRTSGITYRVKPFDFQINDIPEQIVCIFRDNNRFEQTLSSVLDKIYRIGEVYEFKVFQPCPGCMTLRDDAHGLTHNHVDLRIRVNRYDKITCRVADITSQGLKLEYVVAAENSRRSFFSFDDFMNLPYLAGKRWIGVARNIFASAPLADARILAGNSDSEWFMTAVGSLLRFLPQWLSGSSRRRVWVERMIEAIKTVVESREFITVFPKKGYNRGDNARKRLAAAIQQLEYYSEAASLVASGTAGEMIDQTLQAMNASGWIYKPQERMGVMMGVLGIAPRFAHSHISEIFEVIKNHRANPKFMYVFGESFREMLRSYIEGQRSQLNPTDRVALRALAEAIAIELLLVGDGEFDLYDRHRGLLYLLSAVITDKTDGRAVELALRSFAGINSLPLEYGWEDLQEINNVCYHHLSGYSLGPISDVALFEGEKVRVRVSGGIISVAPAWASADEKPALKREVGSGISFQVLLPSRLRHTAEMGDTNLTHHHELWNELEAALREDGVVMPEFIEDRKFKIGDKVEFFVVGCHPDDRYLFDCRLLGSDGDSVRAWLSIWDIIPYPVAFFSYRDLFYDGDLPMVFDGVISDISDNGRISLSMKEVVMDQNSAQASKDRDDEYLVQAKVSDTKGKQYKATSEYGYGILLPKTGDMLEVNRMVMVRINNVNYRPADGKLYINGDVVADSDIEFEEELLKMSHYSYSGGALRGLLFDLSHDRRHEMQEEMYEPSVIDDTDPDDIQYLSSEAVADISLLLEHCAQIRRHNLVGCYTDLAASRLLATIAGDSLRAAMLAKKMSLQEQLSLFARNGRLDLEPIEALLAECHSSGIVDADMSAKMKIVGILAGLDNPAFLHRCLSETEVSSDSLLTSLYSLTVAYNMLDGLGISNVRSSIKERIFEMLSLPSPHFEKSRLSVTEDLYHEFKTSLIYPADNNMLADEKRQGEVVARAVAAFLNAEGGTLYIGVDNGGYPRGLANDFRFLNHGIDGYDIREIQDKFNLQLQRHIRRFLGVTVDGLSFFPDYIRIEYEQIDTNWICRVAVNPFPRAVLFVDGRLFIRKIGENNEITDRKEIQKFILRRRD